MAFLLRSIRCGAFFLYMLSAMLAIFMGCGGCRSSVYQAANLPVECLPPQTTNLETINLAGLADSTVPREVIQPGDVLEITMITDFAKLTATDTPVRVADDGTIIVPLIGKVGVASMKVEQAEQVIAAESVSRGVFRNPCITVAMKQFKTSRITVVGAVNKPGAVDLPRGSCSLLNALVAAGGLTKEAGDEVEIRRTDIRELTNKDQPSAMPQAADGSRSGVTLASHQQQPSAAMLPAVAKVNLTVAAKGAEKVPELKDGDVVNVEKRVLKPVYVLGLVRKPGEFVFPANQDLRVLDAIALAGGCSNPVAEKIMVIRQPAGKAEPMRIAVSLQAAKAGQENIALAPGDTVSVEQTPVTAVVEVIQTFVRVGLGSSFTLF